MGLGDVQVVRGDGLAYVTERLAHDRGLLVAGTPSFPFGRWDLTRGDVEHGRPALGLTHCGSRALHHARHIGCKLEWRAEQAGGCACPSADESLDQFSPGTPDRRLESFWTFDGRRGHRHPRSDIERLSGLGR